MKTVGITGGIGSGKSTICEIFKLFKIPTYQADDRAKYLMQHNVDLVEAITRNFGAESYHEGILNRAYLANKIFSSAEATNKINRLVHPIVGADFRKWTNKQNSPYILKEAALLIESGSYESLDMLLTVYSPIELRIQRVQQRDPQRSNEEIMGIISKQVSEEERNSLADVVIINDGTELLIPQVQSIHNQLTS